MAETARRACTSAQESAHWQVSRRWRRLLTHCKYKRSQLRNVGVAQGFIHLFIFFPKAIIPHQPTIKQNFQFLLKTHKFPHPPPP